jgi:hypothetical protein
MKELFILLLSVWFFPSVALANTNKLPERTIENVADGVIVTYIFKDPIIRSNLMIPGSYLWKYQGFGVNNSSGEPAIPFRSDVFYIPSGYKSRVTLQEATYNDTILVLSPAIPNPPNDVSATVIDSITPYTGFFPPNVLKYGPLQSYRGVGLQSVTIMPVKYNYSQHIIRAYTKIKYKVTFVQDDVIKENNSKSVSDLTSTILSNVTLNFASNYRPSRSINDSTWHSVRDEPDYLIITTTEYVDSIQDFVKWKRMKGNYVDIVARPKGTWTPNDVKSIVELYDYIDYLLIIGGNDDVPGMPFMLDGSGINYAVTDYEYGLPIATNCVPQIFRGRITGDTIPDVITALNKIIQYEKNPIMDESFYKTSLHCAQFQDNDSNSYEDRAFVLTSENIRNHVIDRGFNIYRQFKTYSTHQIFHWSDDFSDGDALPAELQPDTFSWNGNADSICKIINDGALYVLYDGHGDINCWYNPYFQNTDIQLLQNGRKLPVIFSFTCLTGQYDKAYDCFAEKALKKKDGGCVGIIAATDVSYSGNNDALALGVFDAIWPNLRLTYPLKHYSSYTNVSKPMYELGPILDQGLFRMGETFGMWGMKELTYQLYHCFGDPSMRIYTDIPLYFAEPIIFTRGDSIFVFVKDGDCKITFYDKTTKRIKSYKGNFAAYANPSDDLVICLDRHNYVPYISDYAKNVYIQNENIQGETRVYTGENIYVGNHVTSTKPTGDVNIQNSQITIHGSRLELHSGTQIDKNFKFSNR